MCRSPFGLDRSPSSRTASPLSTYSTGPPFSHWPQAVSRYELPFSTHEPSRHGKENGGKKHGDFTYQTSQLPAFHTHATAAVQPDYFGGSTYPARKQHHSSSPPPLFYDYSEPFQPPVDSNDPLILDQSQKYRLGKHLHIYNFLGSSTCESQHETGPTKLGMVQPQIVNLAVSKQASSSSAKRDSRIVHHDHTHPSKQQGPEASIASGEANPTLTEDEAHFTDTPSTETNPDQPGITPKQSLDHGKLAHNQDARSSNHRGIEGYVPKPLGTADDMRSVLHCRSLSMNSSKESNEPVGCTMQAERKPLQPMESGSLSDRHSHHACHNFLSLENDAPKFSFESDRDYLKRLSGKSDFATSSRHGVQAQPTASARGRPQSIFRKIHAPTPRRSLSSPSNKERFSSILSIDEGLHDIDEAAAFSRSARPKLLEASGSTIPSTPIDCSYRPSNPIAASSTRSSGLIAASSTEQDVLNVKENLNGDDAVHTMRALKYSTSLHRNAVLTYDSMIEHEKDKAKESLPFDDQFSVESRSSAAIQEHLRCRSNVTDSSHTFVAPTAAGSTPQTMKELPPLPRSSTVSIPPPQGPKPNSLPFSFTAFRSHERVENGSVTELGNIAASYLKHLDRQGAESPTDQNIQESGAESCSGSLPPRPDSRPWNSEENYPWNDHVPRLEIAAPETMLKTTKLASTSGPCFKLKLHRTSVSSTGSVKIRKPRPSIEARVQKRNSTVSLLTSLGLIKLITLDCTSD